MPRPGPRRQGKTYRLSDSAIADIQAVAERENVIESEAVRLLLSYAYPRMPMGWRPDKE